MGSTARDRTRRERKRWASTRSRHQPGSAGEGAAARNLHEAGAPPQHARRRALGDHDREPEPRDLELARALGNVVRVGRTGGDFSSIQAALDSITTASASNPFLVRVGPGEFFERVAMKPFVDVEGSGEGVTVIRQAGSVATWR